MKWAVLFGALAILLLSLFLPALAYAVSPHASEVEITPKITVKGAAAMGKPAKPPKQAATGILGAPVQGEKWAVIIGISDYSGEVNDLEFADDDALDMVNALTTMYGYKPENIHLFISDYKTNNATAAEILTAINWLSEKAKQDDEVLFFYSGHGARGKANDGDKEAVDEAIVPYECTTDSLIWDGQLAALFSGFAASRIIFIFDSCYSGGMKDLAVAGRIVVMACAESSLSYEFESVQNGQFTYYFVDQGMLSGSADTIDHVSGQADVTVEEAFDYAKVNCKYQNPVISDLFANDLLL
ncbi:MAG: caspase family protein [Candidatus Bathyarchaeia archaeon]